MWNLNGQLTELSIPDLPKRGRQEKTTEARKKAESTTEVKLIKEQELNYDSPQKISIKDALRAAEKKSNEEVRNSEVSANPVYTSTNKKAVKPISEQFLALCWTAYAEQIREDKPRMAVTLKNVQPRIEDEFKIVIELNNRVQLEDFTSTIKTELENFLHREMQNDLITVEASLVESTDAPVKKLYTSEEKFSYLSKKNPLLHDFRKDLNLELE